MSTRPNIITRKQELPLKDDSSTLFLKVMISIAVFLFAVTLAGVLSINSMLLNWNQSILGSLTVQIMPVNNINKEKALEETLDHQTRAVRFLEGRSEIEKVTPLQDEQLEQLIKPWLGDGVNIKGSASYDSYFQTRRAMNDNRVLMPVPTSVLEDNTNIEQNLGY